MTGRTTLAATCLLLLASPVISQERPRPDINESTEFPNVFLSPSADQHPRVFGAIFQMEVVVQRGDADAEIVYANGTVVSDDGLIVSVIDEPNSSQDESGGIQSAALLTLAGGGVPASLVAYEPAYGLAIFRVTGLDLRPLVLSQSPPVANRRVNWHAVFKNGRKTYLYSRPLRLHQSSYQLAGTEDLIEIIDAGSSSLNADRSGSALVADDGTLVGIMGRLEHWNVTPASSPPRLKLAWAVPAHVIERLLEEAGSDG